MNFKTLFMAIVVLTATAPLFSQIRIGVKAGGVFSKMDVTNSYLDSDDMKIKTAYQFGGILNMAVLPTLSLQTEVNYSVKGVKYIYDNLLNQECENNTSLNYVEVPVGLKWNIPVIKLYVIGGGYGAYCTSGKIKTRVKSTSDENDIDFDDSKIKRADYGMFAGIGLNKGIKPITLFLEARYYHGFADISDGEALTRETTMKNRNLAVCAGILIGF